MLNVRDHILSIKNVTAVLEPFGPKIAHDLNKYRIIIESSEGTYLSSVVIEHRYNIIEDIARQFGYLGGPLACACQEIENEGWVYAVYDTEYFNDSDAKLWIVENTSY